MTPVDLPALARRLPPRPLTRFAPSPTGYLHLGHVAHAAWVWGVATALGGRVLLRLEDHDRGRCRPDYDRALMDDLEWLGLIPDLGPVRQSEAGAAYAEALASLARRGLVYHCDCSRKEIAAEAADVANRESRYPGRCRDRGLAPGPGRGLRLWLSPGVETFADARFGAQSQEPSAQCGDLLLRDRSDNWTYQFAVVVDDLRQGVDLVIRGRDLLGSTGRQLALARLLGRERAPVFLHHPLIHRPDGAKLSKAAGDSGIRQLRRAGVGAGEVLGRAAALVGLLPESRPLAPGDLAGLFHRT